MAILEPIKRVLLGILAVGVAVWAFSLGRPAALDAPTEKPPAIRLKLVDEARSPLECRATLWRVGNGERQIWPGAGGVCVAGQLAWQVLEPGTYRLMVQPPGRVLVDLDLDYQGEPIDLGEQVPAVGGIVRGVVLRGGEPIYGAVLALSDGRRHTESGPDGTFAFPGVALGEVVVRAALDGQGDVKSVEVGAEEPAELRMELGDLPERGVLGLRFEMDSGSAVVREIHPSGPAMRHLLVGDLVESIGGVALATLSRQEVVRLLSGTPGEKVVLSIRREGEAQDLVLVRVAHSTL